jgi:hypothetical protein
MTVSKNWQIARRRSLLSTWIWKFQQPNLASLTLTPEGASGAQEAAEEPNQTRIPACVTGPRHFCLMVHYWIDVLRLKKSLPSYRNR